MLKDNLEPKPESDFLTILLTIVNEQLQLDNYILKNINKPISFYLEKKILAFQVEVAELANETRSFKYWSQKPSSEFNIILDETADCLHFLISIGLSLNFNFSTFKNEAEHNQSEVTISFLNLFLASSLLFNEIKNQENNLPKKSDKINILFTTLFQDFLKLIFALKIDWAVLFQSYKDKNKINYQRQQNNY
ncbi:dUTP diphosphatase [Mycoplasma sp. SG1]|uniref:dUTP diphosphatase n=1 Tax=Mycoplasma sp. SG1 TaxID=2810348 RepID=UPI002023F7D7|nr:dUTP diphosphatase [Mycoplasma sp. SG1]URM53194.1 dUTP diphosphatase [Mycoplasma sp. SG1]